MSISIIKKISVAPLLLGLMISITPAMSFAQTQTYQMLEPLPCIQTNTPNSVACPSGPTQNQAGVNFQTYVQYAINLLIALAAVAAVFMIVWGGLEYMTTTAVSGKADGLNRVRNAIYGLLLVLCSYLLLKTIDPRLVAIPTTLVPKIQLKDNLTQNVNLLDNINQQIQQYVDASNKAGNAVALDRQAITDKETRLTDIEQKLSDMKDGVIDATPAQIQELELQQQQLTDELNKVLVTLQVDRAKVEFNGYIGAQLNAANNGNDYRTFLASTNDYLKGTLPGRTDYYKSMVLKVGQFDTSAIDQQASYTALDLQVLEVTAQANSMKQVAAGAYGSNVQTKITMEKLDGTGTADYASKSSAIDALNKQITTISEQAGNLKDSSLKADLLSKISEVQGTVASKK